MSKFELYFYDKGDLLMCKFELCFTLLLPDYEAEIFCFFLNKGYKIKKMWSTPHYVASLLVVSIETDKKMNSEDLDKEIKSISNLKVKYYSYHICDSYNECPPFFSGPNFDFSDSNKELIEKVESMKLFL